MLEQNILNILKDLSDSDRRSNEFSDLFEIIKTLHRSKQIDLLYEDSHRFNFLKNFCYHAENADLSEIYVFLLKETNNKIINNNVAEYMRDRILTNFSHISSGNEYQAKMAEKNLLALVENSDLMNFSNFTDSQKSSLNYHAAKFGLVDIASILLKENPNCFTSKVTHISSPQLIKLIIEQNIDYEDKNNSNATPFYKVVLSTFNNNQEILDLMKGKMNPSVLEAGELDSYFNSLTQHNPSGIEKVLKSNKDWVNLYDKNHVAASIIAINNHRRVLSSLADVKKALPALLSVDNKGNGLWLNAEIFDAHKINPQILATAIKTVPMQANFAGEGVLMQYINKKNSNYSFFMDKSELNEIMTKYIKKGKISFEGLFGDENSQRELAVHLKEKRTYDSASKFISAISIGLVETDQMKKIVPELKGALLINEYIKSYNPENVDVVNEILKNDDFVLTTKDIEFAIKVLSKKTINEGIKTLQVITEKKELNSIFSSASPSPSANNKRL